MTPVVPQRPHFQMAFLAMAAASLAWLWVLPVESLTRVVAARAIALVATLVLVRRLLLLPAPARMAWTMVWAYQAVTFLADLVHADLQVLDAEVSFPNPSDVVYLTTYAFAFAAVVNFTRLLHHDADRRLWLEQRALIAAAITVVAMVLGGPWLLDASGDALTPLIAVAYPVLDLLLVLAMAAAVQGRLRGNQSLQTLLSAFLVFFVLDGAYYLLALVGNETEYRLLEVGWTAALLLISFAAHLQGADPTPAPVVERESVPA